MAPARCTIDRVTELDAPPLAQLADRGYELGALGRAEAYEPDRRIGESELVRDVSVRLDAGPYQTVAPFQPR